MLTYLYNPATATWTQMNSMHTPRAEHTATLLPNGQVLVTGGMSVNSGGIVHVTSTAELYDPPNDTWFPIASILTPRRQHTATLLPNGQVLVAGGVNDSDFPNGFSLMSSEFYDPASNVWYSSSALQTSCTLHTATLLPNGQVLVAGGSSTANGKQATSIAQFYDPPNDTWFPTGSLQTPRDRHTATLLPNGQVLVTGGGSSTAAAFTSTELYHPATGTWTPTGSLNLPRRWATATLLSNGKVLVAGGVDSSTSIPAQAELYDPATGTWAPTGSLQTPRAQHTATLLPNGQVLVVGGQADQQEGGPDGSILASAELFTPPTP